MRKEDGRLCLLDSSAALLRPWNVGLCDCRSTWSQRMLKQAVDAFEVGESQ